MAVHLAVAGDVFDGVFLCCSFSQEMSWMRSETYLSQFLMVFLPTLTEVHESLLLLHYQLYNVKQSDLPISTI